MRYLGWANSLVAGMLVTIWAIACSGGPEEPTPTPSDVARDEVCGFVDQIREGDIAAGKGFSEWIDATGLRLVGFEQGREFNDWASMAFVWHHAYGGGFISDPRVVRNRDHETSEAWRSIEKAALDYLAALCATNEPRELVENIDGCAYWNAAAINRYTTEAMNQLRTAANDGKMRGALSSATSVFLTAEALEDYLEGISLNPETDTRITSVKSVSNRSFSAAASLCIALNVQTP